MASVEQAFSAHFYYPALARRKGWEGEVMLALRVESDGRLTGIHVVGSSGYRVLDHAAMDSMLRARAVPLPGGALVDGLDMVLPVQYRLFDARV
jgi:protein TonB